MRKIKYAILFLTVVICFGYLNPNAAYAAANGATLINVALQDAGGQYISGANVRLESGAVVPEIHKGFYSLPDMPYGEYTIKIEAEGFLTKEWKFNFTAENYTTDYWLVTLTKEILPEKISFRASGVSLAAGEKVFLTLDYEPEHTNSKEIKWKSSNPEIAAVSQGGRVSAVKPGKALIIAETKNNIAAACQITVTEGLIRQGSPNPESIFIETGYPPVNNKFIDMGYTLNYGKVAPVALRVGEDGGITVCAEPEDTSLPISFFELDASMNLVKTVKIKRELPLFGNFIRDGDGNYYVFYGKEVNEDEKSAKNTALVKYDKEGVKLGEILIGANEDDSFKGVRVPFDAGSCKMEIAGGKLCVYFSREMFKSEDGLNHQSSYGLIVDLDNFQRISGADGLKLPYVSHSFDQFVLADGEDFIFADHGDAGEKRGFAFEKLKIASNDSVSAVGLKFKGKSGDNPVFSKMGALCLTEDGYIFAGAAEKNAELKDEWHNGSHNVFVQIIDKDLSKISAPVWLTGYTDKNSENAVFPKMAEISGGRYVVMWEKRGTGKDASSTYKGTYMCVIDGKGNNITDIALITPPVPLNRDDTLRYNPKTGRVCWAAAAENGITVHSLDPLAGFSENAESELTLTVKTTDGEVLDNCEITLKDGTKFTPEDGNKYSAKIPFGNYEATVKRDGYMPKTEMVSFYYTGQETSVILTGASINIYIEDEKGDPILTPAKITINDGTVVPRVREDAAYYSLLSKPFGQYSVTIVVDGYKAQTWTADFNQENYTEKYWVIEMKK